MQKNFTIFRPLFGIFFLLFSNYLNAQSDQYTYVDTVKKLSILNKATVKGYEFKETTSISKDSLRNGFDLVLKDNSFKIVSFILAYECAECDVIILKINGNSVSRKELPFLRSLKKGETIGIDFMKVERKGEAFRVPYFMIYISD